ncbi:MAG: hypothetical protein HUU35_16235, partial [Armatimonadetes bacterium]|nr:hypothetical protein [Armatimonadota bacterium]
MRRCVAMLALGLLAACGGGGGGAPTQPDGPSGTTLQRGVPLVLSTAGESLTVTGLGGDDLVLVLSSEANPTGQAQVTVNGGQQELPQLGVGRERAGLRRDPARPVVPQPLPTLRRQDEERTFLLGGIGFFTSVSAALRYGGEHGLFYVDFDTPAADLTDAQLAELGSSFDQQIYSTVVSLFGEPSDIDDNGRVLVLFTPWVNRRGYGVFSPGDLAPTGGNQADMIYSLVPQPDQGKDYATLRDGLLATLAHELQHLVNYHQKHLLAGLGGEESWLNEGLSFCAEQAGGWLDSPGGSPENVAAYFAAPERYPLVELTGNYQDGHVGASYLFVRYLADRFGDEVFRRLATSALTGRANVAAATGADFGLLLRDWSAALYLSVSGLSTDPRYRISGFDTHGTYTHGGALTGPALSQVDASSGAPSFRAGLARAGLRFIRLSAVP